MGTRDSLLQKWESIEVPGTYRSDADLEADQTLRDMEARFFDQVRIALALGERAVRAGIISVEYRNILSTSDHITDDKVRIVQLNGFQPVAQVMKTRDDPNYLIAQFSTFTLLDRSVDRILQFQEAAVHYEQEDKHNEKS